MKRHLKTTTDRITHKGLVVADCRKKVPDALPVLLGGGPIDFSAFSSLDLCPKCVAAQKPAEQEVYVYVVAPAQQVFDEELTGEVITETIHLVEKAEKAHAKEEN